MVNKNKWIYNYNNLDPDNQLIVAEAIENELSDNEEFLDDDEYDKAKSRIVRNFINSIMNNIKKLKEFNKFVDVFEKFENLSPKNREKAIKKIIPIIERYLSIQEQEDKAMICKQEGHTFGKWKHNKWTEYIDTYIEWQYVRNYPIEHENWERTCSRCGFVEKFENEPQELIDIRKEKNKQVRIKRLEREVKKLKDE